ncbi:TPA: hypothetical protein DEB02_05055 [Candidatus Beckwithbacteria bacterium]|nr:hypothetical protein [Candidatus Beckwithbacteria bacterium]
MKKGFTLIELLVSITIIGILASIGLGTFQNSQKKSRDTRRKNDLKQVSLALEAYLNDKGQYPGDNSDSGQIYGCGADDESLCDWGDEFTDQYGTVYMVEIPADPTLGYTYDYDADDTGTSYQISARLENENDRDVPKDADGNPQSYQGLYCDSAASIQCNYGTSSSNTTAGASRTLVTE